MRTALAFLLVACLWPRTADAGRSFYGWLYGTEVMPERGVELQTWILETNGRSPGDARSSSIWWGPLIGVTDQLELALPFELTSTGSDTADPAFSFRRYGIEARYRLVSSDPVDAPPLAPLVRIAAKRDVAEREMVRVEADAVVSYEVGAVHALIDVGLVGDLRSSSATWGLRPGGGVSVAVGEELRVGAELYSEINLDVASESWAAIGPNLAWTHGRFWLSASLGVGVYHVTTAPRLMWGIAF